MSTSTRDQAGPAPHRGPTSARRERPARAPIAGLQRWVAKPLRADVIAVVALCFVVVLGFAEVPLGGRTFSTSFETSGVDGCGTPSGACPKVGDPRQDPRFDPYASAWQMDPWAYVVHRSLAAHDVPLWNPYQGIGTPLAGNMQTAAFDPMLLPLHLHPTLLVEDLTFLFALMVAAIAAYVLARILRLSYLAAFTAGTIFSLSGWFFSYSNNAWFRTHVYLPILLLFVEWTLRSSRLLPVALLGASVAGMVAVGMPEPMFMVFVAVALYSASRLVFGPRVGSRPRALLRLGGGLALGFALSAPLLMLFKEYLPLSFNTHDVGSGRHTDPADFFLNWLSPNISPTRSSIFSNSRNWVGAGAALLAACALVSTRSMKRYVGWSFVLMGSVLALQIYGGGIVGPTRHLPLWSQANWPEFGTPIIALAVAVLAGIGVQSLTTGELTRARFGVALGGLAAVTLWFVVITDRDLALSVADLGRRSWGTAALAVLVIATSILVMRRGWAAWVTVAVIVLELLILAPRGIYAPRDDPYPKRDWINFLVANTGPGGQRVFSTDGVLFPDTAGVYGLSDPRMIDALYVDRYWKYVSTFISKARYDRFIATGPTEGAPNVAANPMFDLLGIRYVLYRPSLGTKPPEWSNPQYRLVFESKDVAVFENRFAYPRAFVVHNVHRVSSSAAALAYLTKGEARAFPDRSYQVTHKDPSKQAVIEASPHSAPKTASCAADTSSEAQIVDYSSDRVTISVNAACPGLLVLSDTYYPGWKATVNGHTAPLYPTDYALRGVPVPAGKSVVVMRYQPGTFKAGILISIVALSVLTAFALSVLVRSTWWSSKTAQVRARREQMQSLPAPD